MNRFELQKRLNDVLDSSTELTVEEWKDAYSNLYKDCEKKMIMEECIAEEIADRFGENALNDIYDKVEESIKEVLDIENGNLENNEITLEQEQLLDELF